MESKKRLLVVSPLAGAASEVWIIRQMQQFTHFDLGYLAWQEDNTDHGIFRQMPTHILNTHIMDQQNSWYRWWVRLSYLCSKNYFGTSGLEKQKITRQVKEFSPDVILSHFGHAALKILPVAKKLKIPVLAHIHGMDLSVLLRNRWYRMALAANLKNFAGIIVVGRHQEKWVLDHGADKSRVHYIPCGAPFDELNDMPKQPANGKTFIGVGRFVEKKGQEYTVRAFAKLLESCPEATLKFLGGGDDFDRIKALAGELGIADRIEFYGTVGPETVREELHKSDIFVQHTIVPPRGSEEGSPVAIAEAMACGLPIIATKVNGIVDMIEDGRNGFLVEQKDVDSMAGAMEKLIKDSDLRTRIGNENIKSARDNFDSVKQAQKLQQVLLSV